MPKPHPRGPLGQLLLAAGAIDQAELDAALAEQRRTGERIGLVLARRGLDPDQVSRGSSACRTCRGRSSRSPLRSASWMGPWPRACAWCRCP